jgi:hypothetical protein
MSWADILRLFHAAWRLRTSRVERCHTCSSLNHDSPDFLEGAFHAKLDMHFACTRRIAVRNVRWRKPITKWFAWLKRGLKSNWISTDFTRPCDWKSGGESGIIVAALQIKALAVCA